MLKDLRAAIKEYAELDRALPLDIWATALERGLDPEGVYDSYQKPKTKEEILHDG